MDINNIEQLIKLAKTNGLEEIQVQYNKHQAVRLRFPTSPVASQVPSTASSSTSWAPEPSLSSLDAAEQGVVSVQQEHHHVHTPLIGVVYLAPSPGEPLFVTLGQQVKPGDTLCLIEAMKTFNRIEADRAGVIKQCLVDDAQAVEYNQSLFVIELKDQ